MEKGTPGGAGPLVRVGGLAPTQGCAAFAAGAKQARFASERCAWALGCASFLPSDLEPRALSRCQGFGGGDGAWNGGGLVLASVAKQVFLPLARRAPRGGAWVRAWLFAKPSRCVAPLFHMTELELPTSCSCGLMDKAPPS